MGEDKIIEFESFKNTYVFWNIDDYPIPVDSMDKLGPVFGYIFEAVDLMGFKNGFPDVLLYSEKVLCDKKGLEMIDYFEGQVSGERHSWSLRRAPAVTLFMIHMATFIHPKPINFMVIAKPKRELKRVLQCLKSRGHNVLIVEPPPDEECLLFSVDSLLNNSRLLGGGKPRHKSMNLRWTLEQYVEIKEDVSKMVDFSERIPTVKGSQTAVFWDAVDFPFPPGFTPDETYNSIASALVARYFSDNMTIWAYVDDGDDYKIGSWRDVLLSDKETRKRNWASRIHFLHGGDKASRRSRMLNDIYFWIMDSPRMKSYEASLLIFSYQFEGVYYTDILQNLASREYDLLVVTPTLDINKPESPEWPGLLLDKGAFFFEAETIQISPKRHEADAAAAQDETLKKPEGSERPAGLLSDRPLPDATCKSSEDAEDEEMLDSSVTLSMIKPENPERPAGCQIDGGTGWKSSEEPCPKKLKAAAPEETP